jgi:hypothetical protein
MARTKATDRLTIKGLSADDLAWLKEESDRLGCDPENLVRMMIRQRSAAVVVPVGFSPTPPPDGRSWRTHSAIRDNDELGRHFPEDGYSQGGSPPNEAEPSLDEVMAGQPDLAQQASPLPTKPVIAYSPTAGIAGRGTQYQRPPVAAGTPRLPYGPYAPPRNVVPYPQGAYSAFSETELVSVDPDYIGKNSLGDGRMNVMRDNLRHFGVAGTRSRQ